MRNPRNPSTTRRPRSVVELCAGIRGESEEEGERERKRRAGRGHDGRRFYHPVEFIKKIRCSRRQHLIRRHAQRHGMILLDLSSFILSLSLSPSHFQRFIPQRSFSSLIDSPVSHPLSFRTDSTEGGTNSRVFLARVILAIFARGRAVLFERAVSSTRKKKKKIDELRSIERERERERNTRAHTHAQDRNEAIFRPVRFARSNRVPALSATENSVQTQFRSFLYSDSGNAPLESASEAGPIYRLTVTRTKG